MTWRSGLTKRQKAALVAVGVVLAVVVNPVILAAAEDFVSGFYVTQGNIHHNATDGPEVIQAKDYNLRSGNPYTDKSYNLSTENNGWINVSTSDADSSSMVIKIDEINGTWTNTSSITATSGNITLQPSDKNFTTVGGGVTALKFKDVKVNDGQTDLIYSATSTGTIVVETNGTTGTQYGLINSNTQEGLDVATADADGTIDFTGVASGSNVEAEIEELGTLSIRNETEPHNLITECTATVRFYETVEDNPTIQERTDADGDGQIDLTGLPVDEEFVASLRCDQYHNRTVIIDDLSQQESVFLLNVSQPSIENRFTVSDRTGDFPPEDTQIVIQKAINRSQYGGSPSGFAWVNIGGDDLGADEAYVINLARDDRYRIKVQNSNGDTRILGAYTAATTGTIELRIGSVVIDPEAPDTVGWSANRTNVTGQPVRVNFEYNDSTDNTNTIWLEIYEYGNQSNVLLSNTSFSGPFGTFTHTEDVPAAENNTEWVVKWTAERDDDNLQAMKVVGGQRTLIGDMPDWLIAIIFVGSTFMIGGLASQLNGKVMGLAMAGWAAMFWAAGVVPDVLGSGVIALAMIVAGIMFVRDSRGGL